jgi:hypothetical protein
MDIADVVTMAPPPELSMTGMTALHARTEVIKSD